MNGRRTLGLRVRHAVGEPPYGLVARLAVRNGASGLSDLLRSVGLDVVAREVAFAMRTGGRLDLLAELSGLAVSDLRSGIVSSRGEHLHVGEALLGSATGYHFGVAAGRVCGACLSADVARREGPVECRPYRRAWWDLVAFDACVEHALPLRGECPSCFRRLDRRRLNPSRCQCGRDLVHRASPAFTPDELAGEDYLAGRREGFARGGVAVVDAMGLTHAADVLLQLGRAALHGPAPPPQERMTPAERVRAKAAGLTALTDWPRGYHRLLDALGDASGAPGRTNGPHARYGRLYHWLMHAPRSCREPSIHEPLRAEIRRHYGRRWAATLRRRVAGLPAAAHAITLSALAEEVGCSLERATSICIDLDAFPRDGSCGSTPVSTRFEEKVADILRTGVGAPGACEILNIGHGVLRKLMRNDAVPKLTGSGRSTNWFDPGRLQAFLTELRGDAPVVATPPSGSRAMTAVRGGPGRSLVALITALQSGRLAAVGVSWDVPGLPGVLLSERAISALGPRGTAGAATARAAAAVALATASSHEARSCVGARAKLPPAELQKSEPVAGGGMKEKPWIEEVATSRWFAEMQRPQFEAVRAAAEHRLRSGVPSPDRRRGFGMVAVRGPLMRLGGTVGAWGWRRVEPECFPARLDAKLFVDDPLGALPADDLGTRFARAGAFAEAANEVLDANDGVFAAHALEVAEATPARPPGIHSEGGVVLLAIDLMLGGSNSRIVDHFVEALVVESWSTSFGTSRWSLRHQVWDRLERLNAARAMLGYRCPPLRVPGLPAFQRRLDALEQARLQRGK